jgi:predicted acetyltransferase
MDALSDLNTGLFSVLGAGNPREDEIFANWFANDQSHPLMILKGPDPVGFALVTRPRIPAAGQPSANYHMSEFFVRQAHRRVGIGRNAATLIFDRFAGEWEIVEYLRNPGAVTFWRRVLAGYVGERFTEHSRHGEVRQRFNSRGTGSR